MARRASDRDPALDNPDPLSATEPVSAPAPEPAAAEPATARTAEKETGHPGQYVRAKHPQTGDYFTATRALARRMGATLLPDHDAVDKYGQPLPRKPKES
jgi:hypothetical protein